MSSTIQLTGPLGQVVHIAITDYAHSLQVQREWGAKGFSSGEIPSGGYQLPLALEEKFDWALIGARKWTSPEGEEMILHRGHSYRRRELAAVESRKMTLPAAVKYSRGAKSTDPEHIKENGEGEIQYVTLAIFRGGKGSVREYEVAAQAPTRAAQPRPAPQAPQPSADLPPITQEEAQAFWVELGSILSSTIQREVKRLEYVSVKLDRELTSLNGLTAADTEFVLKAARAEPKTP